MALNFDKIKSLFVITEEEYSQTSQSKEKQSTTEKETPKPPKTKATAAPRQERRQQFSAPPAGETTGEFNQKVFDSLTQAISKANLPGEDYLEYIEALQAMKHLPLDEKVKVQTVLATLSTKGMSKQKILESAEYYSKILDNEKSKFNEALKGQTSGQIQRKDQEINQLEKANKEKADQIALLNEEIRKNQEEILRLKNEKTQAETKITKTVNDFNFTFELVTNQIKNNVEKLNQIGDK